MKIEVSDFYKEKGVKTAYVTTNKEPRRVVSLVFEDGSRKGMSYAKYLYTSYYKCEIARGDEVDHINNDKMDDRIENLQVISGKLNRNKSKMIKTMIERVCPVCGVTFLFEKRNLSTHPNPCCSRRCGGIKAHWTQELNQTLKLQTNN